MLYDTVVVIALLMVAAAVVLPLGTADRVAGRDPVYTAYLVLVWFLYLGWCWHRGGMTLGMRAWNVSIVTADGRTPSWRSCALRFGVSLLSAASAGFGFLASLWEPDGRTWHDRASGTWLRHSPRRSGRGSSDRTPQYVDRGGAQQ